MIGRLTNAHNRLISEPAGLFKSGIVKTADDKPIQLLIGLNKRKQARNSQLTICRPLDLSTQCEMCSQQPL